MTELPFRFATGSLGGDRQSVLDTVARAKSIGFDTILAADHLTQMADPLTLLMFIADHTDEYPHIMEAFAPVLERLRACSA